MRLFSLIRFHLHLYYQNSYFLMTMFTSTLTMFVLQYITLSVHHQSGHNHLWIRAGIFGLWTCGTTAAGAIGMQRWQGTLLYIVNNTVSDYVSLGAVVMPAALFGLLSFPVSAGLSLLCGMETFLTLADVSYILLLWIGATILDFMIAALFVLTPHAIVYEELVTLPILLLSGLFTLPNVLSPVAIVSEWLIPTAVPVKLLLQYEAFSLMILLKFVVSVIISFIFSRYVTTYLMRKAKRTGVIGGGI